MIWFSVPSANITFAPSGSFNAVVAVVAKETPLSVSVLVTLSHVESAAPILAVLSKDIASAPPSDAVKSAVLSAIFNHFAVSVILPVTRPVKSYSVSPSYQPINV